MAALYDEPLPVRIGMKRYRDPELFNDPLPIVIVDGDDDNSAKVTSVAGRDGDVVLTKSDVGLGNVNNTADADKPVSTATQNALNLKANASSLASKADLVGGYVPTSQIPALAISTVVPVNSRTEMLALTTAQVQPGDVAVDLSTGSTRGSYILKNTDPTVLGSWVLLNAPIDLVASVNGYTGTIVLAKADIGLGNVNNTADSAKPVSSAQQTALDAKADKLAIANAQAGTAYTIALSDLLRPVELSNSQAVSVTLAASATVPIPVGFACEIVQRGSGQVTVVADTGVTILSRGNAFKLSGTSAVAVVRYLGSDQWLMYGDVTA